MTDDGSIEHDSGLDKRTASFFFRIIRPNSPLARLHFAAHLKLVGRPDGRTAISKIAVFRSGRNCPTAMVEFIERGVTL